MNQHPYPSLGHDSSALMFWFPVRMTMDMNHWNGHAFKPGNVPPTNRYQSISASFGVWNPEMKRSTRSRIMTANSSSVMKNKCSPPVLSQTGNKDKTKADSGLVPAGDKAMSGCKNLTGSATKPDATKGKSAKSSESAVPGSGAGARGGKNNSSSSAQLSDDNGAEVLFFGDDCDGDALVNKLLFGE